LARDGKIKTQEENVKRAEIKVRSNWEAGRKPLEGRFVRPSSTHVPEARRKEPKRNL